MARSQRKRRGRGIVLAGVLTLLAVQATMTYGINRSKLYWADPEYGTTVGNLALRKAEFPQRSLIVVLGTSRSRNGVAADWLSQPVPGEAAPPLVYDACLAGGQPIHMLLMLRRFVAIGAKPDGVVIELLPALMREVETPEGIPARASYLPLNPKREAARLRYDDFDLVRAYDRDRQWTWLRAWIDAQSAPWYTQRYTLTSRYAKLWAPQENVSALNQWTYAIGPYGYCPIRAGTYTDDSRQRAGRVAEDSYRHLLKFEAIDSVYDRTMRALLNYCAEQGIAVVGLLMMPENSGFRSWYAPRTKRLVQGYAAGLAADFGTRVVDARDWIADDQFMDGHHLLESGSIPFSDRFQRDVLRPWSRARD